MQADSLSEETDREWKSGVEEWGKTKEEETYFDIAQLIREGCENKCLNVFREDPRELSGGNEFRRCMK